MSYLPPNKVKLGFWIDWSKGQVLGSTITTTTTTGAVLVAVLAVVISLAAGSLWHLLLFAYHQSRAHKDLGDGLYRQQQALLRSLGGPEKTLWDFSRLAWAWHGKAKNSTLRNVAPAIVTFLFAVASIAASISSSFIISNSNITVLVESNDCGWWTAPPDSSSVLAWAGASASVALDYAKSCYLNEVASASCTSYVQKKLDFSITPAPCPFDETICLGASNLPALALDTGYIDSNDDLGVNAMVGDRVQARSKTTCAPIKTSGYYTVVDGALWHPAYPSTKLPGEQYFRVEYGVLPGLQGTHDSEYHYSTYESNKTTAYKVADWRSGPSFRRSTGKSYIPIEALDRTDADTILIWIFPNAVVYLEPTKDPVFSATKKSSLHFINGPNVPAYKSDHPFGAVACAEQRQFCITNSKGLNCTELAGLPSIGDRLALGANKDQMTTFELIYNAMDGADISLAGGFVGGLDAAGTLEATGVQPFLPDNQWENEVRLWKSFALATLQNRFTAYALGPEERLQNNKKIKFSPFPTASGQALCKKQKMKVEGGFANVNVFGLAFTIALAGTLLLADVLLLRILVFLSRFRKSLAPKIDRWIQDGVLQLQRKAYEGMEAGEWNKLDKEIPLTRPGDQLPDFQLGYPPSRLASADTIRVDSPSGNDSYSVKDEYHVTGKDGLDSITMTYDANTQTLDDHFAASNEDKHDPEANAIDDMRTESRDMTYEVEDDNA